MTSSADVRRKLSEALQLDLIGPAADDLLYANEIISQEPSLWYLSGFLVPHEGRHSQRLDETVNDNTLDQIGERANAEDEAIPEETSSSRKALFPSSIGLSFLLPQRASLLQVSINWGDYIPIKRNDQVDDYWQRQPHQAQLTIPISLATYEKIHIPNTDGLQLIVSIKIVKDNPKLSLGTKAVSLFLVNARPPAPDHQKDIAYIFQAGLIVQVAEGFVARADLTGQDSQDEDERIADLQYQHDYEFAVGHNISVVAIEKAGKCNEIRTIWMPTAEVEKVESSSIDRLELGMDKLGLASNDAQSVQSMLGSLVSAYEFWLQEQGLKQYSADRLKTAQDLLAKSARVKDRIAAGLKALEDPLVLEAFQITNRVIACSIRQRLSNSASEPKWRPFQIAFLLMNILGLSDPVHCERNIVDLLFFPTGGGKTEAYLALAAFTMALRRLKDPGIASSGVTILMRYTLRLLTLDQLGRAATMVCALELERQQNPAKLGSWPFEIGLWVGSATTPNRIGKKGDEDENSARSKILAFNKGKTQQMPIPLENCPWCGTKFSSNSFQLMPNPDYPTRLELNCVNRRCQFRSGNPLPILTIDETIYRRLPAFLLATVDKFASLPWVGESAALFGKVFHHDHNGFYGTVDEDIIVERPPESIVRAPELIIQDELHLISGPLGTMMGLYETAIDHLCTYKIEGIKIAPKIIASTATVKRANNQILALFGRARVEIFPPPVPDRHDSFFARTVPNNQRNGRIYLGIAAQGRSLKVILLRTYLALMAAAQKAYIESGGEKNPDNPADPYMTLVGYFSSLRELGGSRRIVEDEVKSRLEKYANRKRANEQQGLFFSRTIADEPLELTSRVSTFAIAQAKALLAQNFQEKQKLDIVLATNMISVGLDITRLGLMVVYGQPKTVSEYIQATSRVGRDDQRPGLVVTLLNVHRPRDRSHYERFKVWHSSFYRWVEPTSVTPFSPRALDRGLAGVIVALARLGYSRLTLPLKAAEIAQHRHMLNFIAEVICCRAELQKIDRQNLHNRVDSLLDSWQAIAADKGSLQYQNEEGNAPPLLFDPLDPELENQPAIASKFKAQRSLRNVEPTVNLWVENLDKNKDP